MALHLKKDFALLCGVKTKDLSNYIKRGKVVVVGEYVDELDPANASFMQKFAGRAPKADVVLEVEVPKSILSPKVTTRKVEITVPVGDKKLEKVSYHELEKQIKIADLEKKEVDTRIAILKEEKMLGASIPTDLVKNIVAQLSKSLISSFKDGADNFLIEIAKKKDLNVTEIAEMRGVLINIINTSSSKAVSETKKNLQNVISQFSEKKEVGEHD